jgi:hypothetical protein
MGEIACADDRQPLSGRPPGKISDLGVFAAGAGEPRVNVQVRVEHAA